jgi:hypothetical protein
VQTQLNTKSVRTYIQITHVVGFLSGGVGGVNDE